MLKISELKQTNQTDTLKLEGDIIGPWVNELQLCCAPLINRGQTLVLDLADVSFADEAGLALLVSLREQGAIFHQITPLLEAQLKLAQSV